MSFDGVTRPRLLRHVVNCLLDINAKRGLTIKQVLEKVKMALIDIGVRTRGQPNTVSLIRRALRYGMNAGIIRYCNGKFRLAIANSKAQYLFAKKFDLSDYLHKICYEYKKLAQRGNAPSQYSAPESPSRTDEKEDNKRERSKSSDSRKNYKSHHKRRARRERRKRRRVEGSKHDSRRTKRKSSHDRIRREKRTRREKRRKREIERNNKKTSEEEKNWGGYSTDDNSKERLGRSKEHRRRKNDEKRNDRRKNRNSSDSYLKKPERKTNDSEGAEQEQQFAVDPVTNQRIIHDLDSVTPTAKNKVLQKRELTHGPTLSDFSD